MVPFHSVTEIIETSKQLIWTFLRMIPTDYHRVDSVVREKCWWKYCESDDKVN